MIQLLQSRWYQITNQHMGIEFHLVSQIKLKMEVDG